MRTLVTIGTDDGAWAPPRLVELAVSTAPRSGLGITNAEAVTWKVHGRGRIVRGAVLVGGGEWMLVDVPGGVPVVKGQDVIFAAGALQIEVALPTLEALDVQAVLDAGRLRLSLKRGII